MHSIPVCPDDLRKHVLLCKAFTLFPYHLEPRILNNLRQGQIVQMFENILAGIELLTNIAVSQHLARLTELISAVMDHHDACQWSPRHHVTQTHRYPRQRQR
jgi:hypothetical protein